MEGREYLDEIIELEMEEGEQSMYLPEGEVASQEVEAPKSCSFAEMLSSQEMAAPKNFSVAEMLASLQEEDENESEDEGFNLQAYSTLIVPADLALWWKLTCLEKEGQLEAFLPHLQPYIDLLELQEAFEDTKDAVQDRLDAAQQSHAETERKMAEHRQAFAMALKDGHEEPTLKIAYFPRSVLATPDDKLEIDGVRARQMEEDAVDRAMYVSQMAAHQFGVCMYEGGLAVLEAVAASMTAALKAKIEGLGTDSLQLVPVVAEEPTISLPFAPEIAGILEEYRTRSEADLRDCCHLITLKSVTGSARNSARFNWNQSPLLITWDLTGTGTSMKYQKQNGQALLHVQIPPLGPLETIGDKCYLRARSKRLLRDLVFNQLIVAFAMQHHSVHVDLSPFLGLGLDVMALQDSYDQMRRVFSDIQPGQGYQIRKLFLCDSP